MTPPAVPSQRVAHESRRGATAAEAVDLSDDDDDVVIIEENMQPQGHKPPAAAKQPGGSAPAFCQKSMQTFCDSSHRMIHDKDIAFSVWALLKIAKPSCKFTVLGGSWQCQRIAQAETIALGVL